jgi:hypothetical protein
MLQDIVFTNRIPANEGARQWLELRISLCRPGAP